MPSTEKPAPRPVDGNDDLADRLSYLERFHDTCHDARETLLQSAEFMHGVMDCATNAIFALDLEGRFVLINPAGEDIAGLKLEELVGRHYTSLLRPQDRERVTRLFRRAAEQERPVVGAEAAIVRSDGSLRELLLSVVPLHQEGRIVAVVGTAQDVTTQKEMEQELRRRATIDYLTQLFNRGHYMELTTREIARSHRYGSPLCMMILDVDGFKQVNDCYGHLAGDAVLKELARLGMETIRSADAMGRVGGEEFAITLVQCPLERAELVAQRLRRSVAQTRVDWQGQEVGITVSIGVAQLLPDETRVEGLFQRADKALYRAKQKGKNLVELAS